MPSPPPQGSPQRRPNRLTEVIASIPPVALATGVLACVLLGVVLRGPLGALLLVVALLVLGLLLLLGWSSMARPERLLRIAVLVLLAVLTVVRLVPR